MGSSRIPAGRDEDARVSGEKWELFRRVAASTTFQRTARLREFLIYVCEKSLNNQLEDIREAAIGNQVFGRGADYNPSEDNIVRVEARHLRKRLAAYFEGEGKDEPIIITIPKGSYAPVFLPREAAEPTVEEPVVDTPVEIPQRNFTRVKLAASVGILLLGAVCTWQQVALHGMREKVAERDEQAEHPPWSAVFDDTHQTKIVLADSCLVLYEDVAREQVTLNDYVSRNYIKRLQGYANTPELRSLLEIILGRQYTSLADVSLVGKVMQFSRARRDDVVLAYARNLNIRDFKTNHVVLVGAMRANPWLELFEPRMNFRFGFNEQLRRGYFRNVAPRKGEQPMYMQGDATSAESYAVVALLPNLNRTGNVLVIEGTNSEGTEGGAEFLSDHEFTDRILPKLGWKPGRKAPYFELLLKLRAVGGTSKDTEAIAYRVIE